MAKQTTPQKKPLGIKGEEVLDPLMSKMKAAGAKSMTVELDEEASNQAEIDAVNQQNEDMIMRAEEQYGNQIQEYESLKQRAADINMVRDMHANMNKRAGLSAAGARSIGSGAYSSYKISGSEPKMPIFAPPKLTPVPKPTTSKLSVTMQTPQNTGGSKPEKDDHRSLVVDGASMAKGGNTAADVDKKLFNETYTSTAPLVNMTNSQLDAVANVSQLTQTKFKVPRSTGDLNGLSLTQAITAEAKAIVDRVFSKRASDNDKRIYDTYFNNPDATQNVWAVYETIDPKTKKKQYTIGPGSGASGNISDAGGESSTATSFLQYKVGAKDGEPFTLALKPLFKQARQGMREIAEQVFAKNKHAFNAIKTRGLNNDEVKDVNKPGTNEYDRTFDGISYYLAGFFGNIRSDSQESMNVINSALSPTTKASYFGKNGTQYRTLPELSQAKYHFRKTGVPTQSNQSAGAPWGMSANIYGSLSPTPAKVFLNLLGQYEE